MLLCDVCFVFVFLVIWVGWFLLVVCLRYWCWCAASLCCSVFLLVICYYLLWLAYSCLGGLIVLIYVCFCVFMICVVI